jgi:hypothetical protein
MMSAVEEFQPIDSGIRDTNVFLTGEGTHGGSKFISIAI